LRAGRREFAVEDHHVRLDLRLLAVVLVRFVIIEIMGRAGGGRKQRGLLGVLLFGVFFFLLSAQFGFGHPADGFGADFARATRHAGKLAKLSVSEHQCTGKGGPALGQSRNGLKPECRH